MKLTRPDGSTLWLTYCMNVHPGGTLVSTAEAIEKTVLPLKRRACPGNCFPCCFFLLVYLFLCQAVNFYWIMRVLSDNSDLLGGSTGYSILY